MFNSVKTINLRGSTWIINIVKTYLSGKGSHGHHYMVVRSKTKQTSF